MRLIKADEHHKIISKLLEIVEGSNNLLKAQRKLYEDLNDLYNNYGSVYSELERTVRLPTNEEADNAIEFNQKLKQELQYLQDPVFLQSILDDGSQT